MAENGNGIPPFEPAILTEEEVAALGGELPNNGPDFDINSKNPTFDRQSVQPPTQVYLDRSVRVLTRIETSLDDVIVTVTLFLLRADGEMDELNFDVAGRGDMDVSESIYEPLGGYLLGVSVTTETPAAYFGTTFVTVALARGGPNSFVAPRILLAGYVSQFQYISWPQFAPHNSIEGQGYVRSIIGTTPAAGANILETVPTNRRWKLISLKFRLLTDANVANRRIILLFTNGSAIVMQLESGLTQPAGLTTTYAWGSGLVPGNATTFNQAFGLPHGLILTSGGTFGTSTPSLQVGDQYDRVHYQVEEWLERA